MIIKTICVLTFAIILSLNSEAQTKRIAHKSHSGSAEFLRLDGPDNFGLGPMQGRTDTLDTKKVTPKKPAPKKPVPEKALPVKPKPVPVPSPNYPVAIPESPADTTKKK